MEKHSKLHASKSIAHTYPHIVVHIVHKQIKTTAENKCYTNFIHRNNLAF